MVKRSIKYVIDFIVKLLTSPTLLRLHQRTIYFRNFVYSRVIDSLLKNSLGSNIFEYPVILKGPKYIELGRGFSARARLRIEAWDRYRSHQFEPVIKIGNDVNINFDCHIGAINRVEIGNNVLVGSRVLIIDHNHGEIMKASFELSPIERPLFSAGPVIIHDNVWIGEGVAILPNVRIGENAIIGANSVVTSDVPANSVVGGIPARVLKQL